MTKLCIKCIYCRPAGGVRMTPVYLCGRLQTVGIDPVDGKPLFHGKELTCASERALDSAETCGPEGQHFTEVNPPRPPCQ